MYPQGLYISDTKTTLNPDFCREVLKLIDAEPWRTDLNRRTQHYGARYDYTTKKLFYDVPPLDKCYGIVGIIRAITPLFHVLCDMHNVPRKELQQVIVNEYKSKQRISAHTDSPIFGPIVLTVTFGDPQDFVMTNKVTHESCVVTPWNGCIVALCGESRNMWTHETLPVAQNGFRRISVTFRTIT